ncbi:hypothetical protein L7F22_012685 [Adiantum nelumboides]|nr:hypothetical protein [Adiantum nelumboides]
MSDCSHSLTSLYNKRTPSILTAPQLLCALHVSTLCRSLGACSLRAIHLLPTSHIHTLSPPLTFARHALKEEDCAKLHAPSDRATTLLYRTLIASQGNRGMVTMVGTAIACPRFCGVAAANTKPIMELILSLFGLTPLIAANRARKQAANRSVLVLSTVGELHGGVGDATQIKCINILVS